MSYYGAGMLRARWASWRDWRQQRRGQANARWGWIKPPAGRGPAIWMQGFADFDDQRLAADLAKASREKRLDLRVVLTFEAEHPDLLEQMDGVPGLGYGFGPCDHPQAVARALERLTPLRYLALGTPPRRPLAAALTQRSTPAVRRGPGPGLGLLPPVEAVYPRNVEQAEAWRSLLPAERIEDPVDFSTLITVAQVEPNFRALACGGDDWQLWWVAGVSAASAGRWIQAWQGSPLRRSGLLFLSGQGVAPAGLERMSRWARTPLAPGSALWVDEGRWHPALAVAAQGVHLEAASTGDIWQAFAGGRPLSAAPLSRLPQPEAMGPELVPILTAPGAVLARWQGLLGDPMAAREQGDAARRAFWAERRRAGERLPAFLERVFAW
jgi:hypothetical protein